MKVQILVAIVVAVLNFGNGIGIIDTGANKF